MVDSSPDRPPVGWADVATKQDLVHLETVMNMRFDAVDRRFDVVEVRLDRFESKVDDIGRELRTLTWKLVTAVIAMMAVVICRRSSLIAVVRRRYSYGVGRRQRPTSSSNLVT